MFGARRSHDMKTQNVHLARWKSAMSFDIAMSTAGCRLTSRCQVEVPNSDIVMSTSRCHPTPHLPRPPSSHMPVFNSCRTMRATAHSFCVWRIHAFASLISSGFLFFRCRPVTRLHGLPVKSHQPVRLKVILICQYCG